MNKKYSLTDKSITVNGKKLFQIKAEISFGSVTKGELGGYIEKEENLSHDGNAWVSNNARVCDNARVYDNAQVYGNAWVSGNAWVYGNARVCDNAQVYDNAWVSGNARVYGNAWVSGDAHVSGNARVSGNAWVSAKASFTKGRFIGGDDSGKITDITDSTGSTFWKKQYVLGDYEIVSIKDEVCEQSLSGKEVTVTVNGKEYKAVIK